MGSFIGVIVVIALFCAYSYFAYRISFRPLNKALEELEKQKGLTVGGLTEDGKFSLEAVRCVGCCGLAPVMTIAGEVFGKVTKDQVAGVLDKFS